MKHGSPLAGQNEDFLGWPFAGSAHGPKATRFSQASTPYHIRSPVIPIYPLATTNECTRPVSLVSQTKTTHK